MMRWLNPMQVNILIQSLNQSRCSIATVLVTFDLVVSSCPKYNQMQLVSALLVVMVMMTMMMAVVLPVLHHTDECVGTFEDSFCEVIFIRTNQSGSDDHQPLHSSINQSINQSLDPFNHITHC